MHDHGRPRFARLLAPLALIAFAVVVAAMVLGSGVIGDDDDGDKSASTSDLPTATERTDHRRAPADAAAPPTRSRPGDTLERHRRRDRDPVERLQELNPELDPQALVAGQKIKLRE